MQFRIEFAADAVARDRGHEHVGVTVLVNDKDRTRLVAPAIGKRKPREQDISEWHDNPSPYSAS